MKFICHLSVLLWALALTSCSPSTSEQKAPEINAEELKELLASGKEVVLVDVRKPEEFQAGHLKGATNIDFKAEDFEQQIAQLDTNKTYVLYCVSGNRSGKAGKQMLEKNFGSVYNAGGFEELKEGGLATTSEVQTE